MTHTPDTTAPPRAALLATLDARVRSEAAALDRVHHCDALTLLRALPDGYVDLIATDPPYMGVKDEWWDKQWATADAYIAWIGELCQEWRRVLKPNGSLYVFASPQMAAQVEVEIGRWFNVLNTITWRKPQFSTKAEMFDKETMRAFFPSSERIIFAEQNQSDYCANGQAYAGIKEWFRSRAKACGIVNKQFNEALGFATTGSGVAGTIIGEKAEFLMPSQAMYNRFQRAFPDVFNREYASLREEYENLKHKYEALRRPFEITPFDRYTDVWSFATVGHYPGKHPAEKPLALMRHIVKVSSRPGSVVLDCFCGSGATLEAARRLGRHFIGCDLDAHWAQYARRRLAQPYTPDMFETLSDPTPAQDAEQLALFAGTAAGHT